MAAKSKREKLNISFFQRPEEEIKKNITIDPELQNLIPPLADDEFEQLQQNIMAEGCREPLVLWHHNDQYILVDGHNRYNICSKHHIRFNIQLREFYSKEQAKDWMIANQLGRRNLTAIQQSYLRGKRYANEKNAWGGTRQQSARAKGHNAHLPLQTASRLATEYGVNEKTIRRDEQFANGLEKLTKGNSELRWKILNGQIKAGKKTVTGLTDMPNKYIQSVSKKLNETGNLEEALKLCQKAPEKAVSREITDALSEIKKQIMVTTDLVIKSAHDPDQRSKAVAELKRLVNEIEQVVTK